jgi:hypothetical protein
MFDEYWFDIEIFKRKNKIICPCATNRWSWNWIEHWKGSGGGGGSFSFSLETFLSKWNVHREKWKKDVEPFDLSLFDFELGVLLGDSTFWLSFFFVGFVWLINCWFESICSWRIDLNDWETW